MVAILSDFLAKYLAKQPPGDIIRAALIEVLKDSYTITLSPDAVRIDRGIAYIRASAAIKNEIFIQKANIMADIKEKQPSSRLLDIR